MDQAKKQTWLKQTWYVAATSDEVQDKPFGRQICGERIVFFRNLDGIVAALEDFCPHRGAALSLGYVEDGRLVCGYHGLAVGCSGKVESMPKQRVESFPKARTFPVVERYGFIWVWPGSSEKADPNEIPVLEWFNNPDWVYAGGMYHVRSDYRLMIDNLMDLTHETYVHRDTIGQKEIDEAEVVTTVEGESVFTKRFMYDIPAPAFWRMALKTEGLPDNGNVDRWQICKFSLPSNVMLDVGVAPIGEGGFLAPRGKKANSIVVDFITPETETSHWYFWGLARSFCVSDDQLTIRIQKDQGRIFGEDLEVIERQQENFLNYPNKKLLRLDIDSGGVRSRMLIDRMIKREVEQSNQ